MHGGPGTSQLTLMRRQTRPLEAHFIVVNWDQRGAGKSFAAGDDRSRMNIAQFVDDAIDLSSSLARRFGRRKVLLVGHSWGTVIGTLAAARRPDLFSAYVGIGQMSNMAESEPELARQDLFSLVPELSVPVTFCLGRHDHEVPAELSARYFAALRAPKKELVWFERSAHMPNTEEPDKFNRLLIERVRPGIAGET